MRKVVAPPGFIGFKPYGHTSDSSLVVELLYEEYEALKLADYDF
ncbi:MAG: DNA-binding protein, partial [Bacteroidales bacterium]|nr:DNA-binding protein [Bacteroidales bacterium]